MNNFTNNLTKKGVGFKKIYYRRKIIESKDYIKIRYMQANVQNFILKVNLKIKFWISFWLIKMTDLKSNKFKILERPRNQNHKYIKIL